LVDDTHMVSIIVPVFNSKKYLQRCIDSILAQRYQNIELILINDGSTDESGGICDSYALKDKRVKVIHKENSGPSDARNCGIRTSEGELIFFIDSDDYLETEAIENLVDSQHHHGADLVIADFNKIIDKTAVASGHETTFTKNQLLTKNEIIDYTRRYLRAPNRFPLLTQSWGRLFKTSIIKDNKILFDTSLRTFEDVAFNFDYLRYVNKLYFVKKVLYNFLIHTDHLSATMKMCGAPGWGRGMCGAPETLFGYRAALRQARQFLRESEVDAPIREEIGEAYVRYTIIQLIRLCLQINTSNKASVHKFVRELVRDPMLRNGLRFYSANKGESKILPFLLKLKAARLIMWYSSYRAKKRYGGTVR